VISEDKRYETVSSLLLELDAVGDVTLSELALRGNVGECGVVGQQFSFSRPGASLRVDLKRGDDPDDDFVFSDDAAGVEIKVPKSYLGTCSGVVASSLHDLDLTLTNLFPRSPTAESVQESASKRLIGPPDGLHDAVASFTVLPAIGREETVIRDEDDKVFVEFKTDRRVKKVRLDMENVPFLQRTKRPECVYWDYQALDWRDFGCELDRRRSTESTAVCACDHLTNFAIIFGGGDADDKVLSLVSRILGAISCACFAVTLFFMHTFT